MNRIFAEQLNANLQKKLTDLYFLVGQDPLLLNESQDNIYQVALQQGFDEKVQIQVDNSTNWNDLFERCQSIGLFFNKQVIILDLPENLTVLLQNYLAELISLLNQDIVLILQLPKLTKAMEKQKWFTLISEKNIQATLVNCQTPSLEQLPRWIDIRAKSMALTLDEQANQLLCYSYENNLLALKQNLQLLALLYPDGKISHQRAQLSVEQAAVFTPFQWVDALLAGKANRAKRILEELKNEEIQPVILLRSLQREIMTLLSLAKPQQKYHLDDRLPRHQLRENFDQLKIWQNRRPLFTQAFQRLTYRQLYQIIQQLAEIERQAKREFSDDIWQHLETISLLICQNNS